MLNFIISLFKRKTKSPYVVTAFINGEFYVSKLHKKVDICISIEMNDHREATLISNSTLLSLVREGYLFRQHFIQEPLIKHKLPHEYGEHFIPFSLRNKFILPNKEDITNQIQF